MDLAALHLPERVPDRVVGPDRHEVGRHEVGDPEVLDLVPLHGGPAAGKASIAAERIRKFFRSPRPDNEDEVNSARSEARRDSADPPEPFLDPRHFRATMAFRFEADLAEPLCAWLRAAGFRVCVEVPIVSRRADLFAWRGENVTAIEMKLHDWAEALHQAVAYQLAADWTWVAMPLAAASRAYRERWRFEAERVGLLAVDDRGKVRTPISAGRSPRLLPFVQDKILATWREPKVGDD